jgi:hypothetical protein
MPSRVAPLGGPRRAPPPRSGGWIPRWAWRSPRWVRWPGAVTNAGVRRSVARSGAPVACRGGCRPRCNPFRVKGFRGGPNSLKPRTITIAMSPAPLPGAPGSDIWRRRRGSRTAACHAEVGFTATSGPPPARGRC